MTEWRDAPSVLIRASLALAPSLLLLTLSVVFLDLRTAILMLPAAAFLPFLLKSLAKFRHTELPDAIILRRDGPEIVAMMSVPLLSGESLESAARFVAESDSLKSSSWFKGLLWRVGTRSLSSVREGLGSSPEMNDGSALGLSMQLLLAASDAGSDKERTDLVEEANRIVIEGMRSSLDRYASSLNVPAMTVFAAGIVLPLICVSLMPLISLGAGPGNGGSIGLLAVFAMLLLPIGVAVYISKVLSRSPVQPEYSHDSRWGLGILVTIPLILVLMRWTADPIVSLALGSIPLCLICWASLRGREMERSAMTGSDELLGANLLRLGNNLRNGCGVDTSLLAASPAEGRVASSVSMLCHILSTTRATVDEAVRRSFQGMPDSFMMTYLTALEAARKDVRQAGILCVRMGKHLHQRASSREDVMNRMRSLTDMMTGTSALFAPIVLGIGLSLASPLDSMGGAIDPMTFTLTGIYLIELAILTSWMGARLEGLHGSAPVAYRAAMRIPVAIIIFILSWESLSRGILGI